jgi:hypothetical protein
MVKWFKAGHKNVTGVSAGYILLTGSVTFQEIFIS